MTIAVNAPQLRLGRQSYSNTPRCQCLCETRAFIEQQRCSESTLKCEIRQAFARSRGGVGVHALACCPSLFSRYPGRLAPERRLMLAFWNVVPDFTHFVRRAWGP